ncbi:hypothetical protein MKW98_017367 [Papaver atlanticum]|uniref:Uncharacterized protein n=1 Tax=Papaver atlanticum TaxID=357466 RepID=A0AAD4SSE9_9MAGN|nr:hypothetical protein MKW98_017367 [Papaver atlanticum]
MENKGGPLEQPGTLEAEAEAPTKAHWVILLLGAVAWILLPMAVLYVLITEFGYPIVFALGVGFVTAGLLYPFGIYIVLPIIIFNTRVKNQKRAVSKLLMAGLFFINFGKHGAFFAATAGILSLVCLIGARFSRDPTGFSKVTLFIEIRLWLNITVTIFACGICYFAILTEIKNSAQKWKDVLNAGKMSVEVMEALDV